MVYSNRRISPFLWNAFGKPVGTAARVHANDIIMVARVTPEGAKQMKEAAWVSQKYSVI